MIDTAELVPTLPTTVPVTVTGSGIGAMKYVKSRTATQSELFLRGRLITNEFRVTGSVHKSTLKTYVEVWQCGGGYSCLCARDSVCVPSQAAGGVGVGVLMFLLVLTCGTCRTRKRTY